MKTASSILGHTIAIFLFAIVLMASGSAGFGQQSVAKSQEISEADGQPVLLKHLPDGAQAQSVFFTTAKSDLEVAVGDEPVLDVVEFSAGTEAASAVYPQGRLVIVEFTNPQASAEADIRIQQFLSATPHPPTVYRRIGNYNVFVFGTADPTAASALLDQVKYEKTVQWLGEDPFLMQKLQRYMVTTSLDIMISTVLVIVLGIATSIVAGIAAGLIFFRIRDQRRASRRAFSDAGGLTRLNLDGLSE